MSDLLPEVWCAAFSCSLPPRPMAAFSFDVQIPPASVNVRDVAPGYGVLSVPVTGLLATDAVPQMRLAITPNGGSTVEFTITPQALASGQLVPGNDATTRVGQFSLDPTTVALIATAGKATYSVRLWVTRAGVTQDREIQAGGMTARVASVSRSLNTVTTVTVTPATPSAAPGTMTQLTAAATDALGNPVAGQVFAWVSSNPAVATVDQNGLVTVVAVGTAVISATAQGVTGLATMTGSSPAFAAPSEGQVPTYRSGAWKPENPDTRYLQLVATALPASVLSSSLTTVGILASPHMTGPVVDSGGLSISAGDLNVAAGSLKLGGVVTVMQFSAWTKFFDLQGRAALWLGGTGDPTNYYDNAQHVFRGVNGGAGATAATISAAGTLTLTGGLYVNGANITIGNQGIDGAYISFLATGDTYNRLSIQNSGRLNWGSGAAASDVQLQRTSTATLGVTGALTVSNGLTVAAGGLTVTAGGLTVSAGGATITGDTTITGNLSALGSAALIASTGANARFIAGNGTGMGSVTLHAGDAGQTGYVEWYAPAGGRTAYMGYNGAGVTLTLQTGTFSVTGGAASFGAALTVGGAVGFNGAAALAKPTITGAKGGNAALASLLTALASYGLVTDTTT